MKKLALVIIFTMLAGSAFAGSWNQNNLGIYVDANGTDNCTYGTGFVHCYLVGTGLQTATVGGFECKIVPTGPLMSTDLINVAYPADAINLGGYRREFEWVVAYGQVVPVNNGTCMFMEFDLAISDDLTPTEVFLETNYFQSYPGANAYLDGADLNVILPLYNATGDPLTGADLPVFTVNGQCVVPTENASWSDVKSLFR